MIWIQFSSASDDSPATTFVGAEVEVSIIVLTDPPVEGMVIKAGKVHGPNDTTQDLVFDEHSSASLKLNSGEHPEGRYEVTATATKMGYHDAPLEAHFYYLFEVPDIPELDEGV